MGVVSRRWMWLETMGVVVRRYNYSNIDFLILLFLYLFFLQQHFYFLFIF